MIIFSEDRENPVSSSILLNILRFQIKPVVFKALASVSALDLVCADGYVGSSKCDRNNVNTEVPVWEKWMESFSSEQFISP